MSTADQIIQKAVASGQMRPDDAIGFRQNLNYLSQKYGYSVDDFAIVMLRETGTLNPATDSGWGCVGLIQFCFGGSLGTTRYGQTEQSILRMSATQQTAPGGPIDQYFSAQGLKTNPDKSRGMLYASILCPVGMSGGPDTPFPAGPCNVAGQAPGLRKNGVITRSTLEQGSGEFASQYLGSPIGPSNPALPGGAAGSPSTPGGGLPVPGASSFLLVSRDPCDQPWFQVPAHEWPGCAMKMLGSVVGAGSSIGPPTLGFGANAVAPDAAETPYTGPMNPGGFILPVRGVFTSGFGPRWGRFHYGVDIAAPTGTPIKAAADGKVIKLRHDYPGSTGGNYLEISHGALCSAYLHLSKFATQQGAIVKQGQVIGYVGSTGRSTGPHLHLEFAQNNCSSSIDPVKVLPEINSLPRK